LYLVLSGCGFHLRGLDRAVLPAELAELRVVVQDSVAAHDPLLAAMREALTARADARITDRADAPVLVLSGERAVSQVLSVGTTGKVSEYLLRYEVSFRLLDAEGKERLAPQTIRLQRSYTFDPLNVLAKEREEKDLAHEMRTDAAGQIVRRLSRVSLK
jgi:LPS-assembly lipoprotein